MRWKAAWQGSYALDSGAARQQCDGATSRLEASVRRLSSLSPPVQQRGEQLCAGWRRGEPAACWRRPSTRDARPSSLVSVAAWTAARRGGCALAPPLGSRPPPVASRLCRRLDSGAARQQCTGAASRLEAPVRRLSSPSPPGQRRGETAMCWTAVRRGSSALAPTLTRGLRPSPLASSPSGRRRGEQLCAGRRRGEPAACWRRLSTRGARPSPLVSVAA